MRSIRWLPVLLLFAAPCSGGGGGGGGNGKPSEAQMIAWCEEIAAAYCRTSFRCYPGMAAQYWGVSDANGCSQAAHSDCTEDPSLSDPEEEEEETCEPSQYPTDSQVDQCAAEAEAADCDSEAADSPTCEQIFEMTSCGGEVDGGSDQIPDGGSGKPIDGGNGDVDGGASDVDAAVSTCDYPGTPDCSGACSHLTSLACSGVPIPSAGCSTMCRGGTANGSSNNPDLWVCIKSAADCTALAFCWTCLE
ncbi:MAG: hypothetical protein V2A73_11540 [Pseudomonadota bacterium]